MFIDLFKVPIYMFMKTILIGAVRDIFSEVNFLSGRGRFSAEKLRTRPQS